MLTYRSNKAGSFLEFVILGAKRRLKWLLIPSSVELAGLKLFADTLAATTVGPGSSSQARVSDACVIPVGAVDSRPYAAAVIGVPRAEARYAGRGLERGLGTQLGTVEL